jgi:pantoate--beta-alanine ligase
LAKLINLPVKVIICPTQRENSGLAMSSRNMRLNEEEKIKAAKIYETLLLISQEIKNDTFDLKSLKEKGIMTLTSAGFKVDYLEFANAATLELISEWDGKTSMILLIAAFLSGVRLIDNLVV